MERGEFGMELRGAGGTCKGWQRRRKAGKEMEMVEGERLDFT